MRHTRLGTQAQTAIDDEGQGVSTAAAETARTFAANRAVGWIALAVQARAGMTRRARVREEGSLRVRFPGPASAELEAVIVNTAGGVAGGDRFAPRRDRRARRAAGRFDCRGGKGLPYARTGRDHRREACRGCVFLARLAAAGDDPVQPS